MAKPAEYITLEGRNTVRDALTSGQRITTLIVSYGSLKDPKIKEIEELAKDKGVEIKVIDSDEMEKMAESRNPQGVIALMDVPEITSLEQILKDKRNAFILLLNHIDFEQNLLQQFG